MSDKSEPLVMLTVRIPDSLKQQAKMVAAQERSTIQDIVKQLLNNYVNAKAKWNKQ